MQKYEYTMVKLWFNNKRKSIKMMNKYAAEGWRLRNINQQIYFTSYTFEREV